MLVEGPVARSIRFEVAGEEKTPYRRYPKPAQFVELEQQDHLLIELSGTQARPDEAKRRTETFETIAAATEGYDGAAQTLREDGWRQVRNSMIEEAKSHLELMRGATIRGNPSAVADRSNDFGYLDTDPIRRLCGCFGARADRGLHGLDFY